jgi:hypothetical protein
MRARASEPTRTDATALRVQAVPLVLVEPGPHPPDRTVAAEIAVTTGAGTGSRLTVRRVYGVGRIGLAVTGVAALLGYFEYVLGFATFANYNFFSYFTVLSGMAAVVAFVAAAIVAFRREVDPPWLDWFRLLITTYILVSGIVYLTIVIESSSRAYTIEVPWSSQLLHFWIPVIALLDWLTDAGKARLPWKTTAWVMLVPSIWGAFTLIRGALVGWYPYFFLDPVQVSGPLETMLYSLVAVALFTGTAAALTATTRLRRPVRRPPRG